MYNKIALKTKKSIIKSTTKNLTLADYNGTAKPNKRKVNFNAKQYACAISEMAHEAYQQ